MVERDFEQSSWGYEEMLRKLHHADVQPVMVSSHPRSGTHLLMDTLRLNFPACQGWKLWGERFDRLYLNIDLATSASEVLGPDTMHRVLMRSRRPLVKTHTLPPLDRFAWGPVECALEPHFADWLKEKATFLYTYRDGRDVMTSLHEYMWGFDASARVPLGEFIRQKSRGISRPRMWAAHVRSWCGAAPSVYCVRMEELLNNTEVTLRGIADALKLPFDLPIRLPAKTKSVAQNRWNRLFNVHPESTAILARPLNHSAKDWRAALSQADREFFREEVGTLLQTLGYEDSDDWVSDPSKSLAKVAGSAPPQRPCDA